MACNESGTAGRDGVPELAVSPDALTFATIAGGAEPAPRSLVVSNAGSGTLLAPAVAVTYTGESGWLTVSVEGTSAPYTVVVRATLGSLSTGTYQALVSVSSEGALHTPVAVPVTFQVDPPPPPAPLIVIAPASLAFLATAGGSDPPALALAVTSGTSTTLASPTTSVSYGSGTGWLSISPGAASTPYVVMVGATLSSLGPGIYQAIISLASEGATNSPVAVPVTFLVGAPPVPPAMAVTPSSLAFSTQEGTAGSTAQELVVGNSGGGTLARPSVSVGYANGSGWLVATVSVASAPYGVTVTATADALAAGTYQATLSIASSGASNSPVAVPVTLEVAAGARGSLSASSRTSQTGQAGQPVADPPAVLVLDRSGRVLPGTPVTFSIAAGGGALTGANATSGADGIARVGSWVLGPSGAQGVLATAAEFAGSPVAFAAVIVGIAYDISLRFLNPPTDSQRLAFQRARERIEQVIIGDLPDVPLRLSAAEAASCGGGPPIDETVDDLLIVVLLGPIDGQGGTLGLAAPCVVRDGSGLPVLGVMRFDTADLPALESTGRLDAVVLHEMMHVVGVGTLWTSMSPPLLSGAGGLDPIFTGSNAIDAFLNFNGGAFYSGTPVPVENTGGSGTRDSHWRESVFKNELMTGWISGATQPLSRTTGASLLDLGYEVNLAAADPFDLATAGVRAGSEPPSIPLEDDVLRIPLFTVDPIGTLRPSR